LFGPLIIIYIFILIKPMYWSINYWIVVIIVQISKVFPLVTNVHVQTII